MMRHRARIVGASLATILVASEGGAQRATVGLRALRDRIVMDTVGLNIVVPHATVRVYHATLVAFEALKIPVTLADSSERLVGNLKLSKSGSLAGSSFTRWISCGNTMSGPRAATYRITMPIVVMLDPVGPDKTKFRVAMVAQAQDMTGASTEPIMCGTTGALEKRIEEEVLKHLVASSQ